MDIQVNWDNEEHTIIRYDYGPAWTWQNFAAAIEQAQAMVGADGRTVDIIANFTEGAPPPVGALTRFSSAMRGNPSGVGMVVITGGGMFVTLLVSTFSQVYRGLARHVQVAATLEEARELLRVRRAARLRDRDQVSQ